MDIFNKQKILALEQELNKYKHIKNISAEVDKLHQQKYELENIITYVSNEILEQQ